MKLETIAVTLAFVTPIAVWLFIGSRIDRGRAAREAAGEEVDGTWLSRHRTKVIASGLVILALELTNFAVNGPWNEVLLTGDADHSPAATWKLVLSEFSIVVGFIAIVTALGWMATWASRRRLRGMPDRGKESLILDGRALRVARRVWQWVFWLAATVSGLYLFGLWQEASRVSRGFVFFGELGDTGFYSMPTSMARVVTGEAVVPGWYPWLVVGRQAIASFAALALGWFIFARKPRHFMALYLSLFIAVAPVLGFGNGSTERFQAVAGIGDLVAVVGDGLAVLSLLMLGAFLWIFPDGRFRGAVLRWYLLGFGLGAAVLLARESAGEDLAYLVFFPLVSLYIVGGLSTQIFRYREAALEQRQQARYVLAALVLLVLWVTFGRSLYELVPGNGWATLVWQQTYLSIDAATPLILGFGILYLVRRQGWWDMKLFWSRSGLVAAVAPALGAVYVVIVAVLAAGSELIFGSVSQTPAILVATTGAALLYRPIRRRFERWIDVRWFPSRSAADRVLDQFTSEVRDELDGVAIGSKLTSTVDAVLQPTQTGLWLAPPGGRT